MGRTALELTQATIFVWGPLCHPPLLQVVLGRSAVLRAARLDGYRVTGLDHPGLRADPDGTVAGAVIEDAAQGDRDRMAFFLASGAERRVTVVLSSGGPGTAMTMVVAPDDDDADWSMTDWERRRGALAVAVAQDVMTLYGQRSAQDVARRRMAMAVRAASRLRSATDPAPATLRRSARAGDVRIDGFAQPYAHFFAVEEYEVAFRRFDGGMSDAVNRAVFLSGDAVTVLPYDAVRDRVMVIEQFRAGLYARGDRNPWSLEAIAGRIDPGETPEQSARREALEEAGLVLGTILPVANYYPSPGAKSEYLYSCVALTDLPDDTPRLGGLEEEAEDIRGHVIPFDRLMALVATGEVTNAPLILTAYWLQRERDRLRAG
jgi:ADP-ribose pyrophosphatase